MLMNNVASTAVVMMVVLMEVLTMTMTMTAITTMIIITIMMEIIVNLFFFNLYAVVAMNIVAWVTNSLNAR